MHAVSYLSRSLTDAEKKHPITHLKVADALSRVTIKWSDLPTYWNSLDRPFVFEPEEEEDPPAEIDEGENWENINLDSIRQHTKYDNILSIVKEQIKGKWKNFNKNEADKDVLKFFHQKGYLKFKKGIVRLNSLLVIPSDMRNELLQALHRSHMGIEKIKRRSRGKIYWPGINRDIENLVGSCEKCQLKAANPPKIHIPWPKAKYSMERLHVDFAAYGHQSFFIVIDAYSKYPFAKIMANTNAEHTIKAPEEVFLLFGHPTSIISDNGPQFRSELFEKFLSDKNIIHLTISPYSPSSNGAAENFVKSLKSAIKKRLEKDSTKA
jgi:hypothetical protein